jgi:hypothetical protein
LPPITIETQLSTLELLGAIVHEVPKRFKSSDPDPATFSQVESQISPELTLFFKQKIIGGLSGDRAFRICYSAYEESPVSNHASEFIGNPLTHFVKKSQEITQHIYNIQNGQNSGGLMVFFNGLIKGKNVLIILKLERDSGAQVKNNTTRKSLDIVEVKDLMLTQKTKLFKVVLLADRGKMGWNFDGLMMDYQIVSTTDRIFAHFFMKNFLGCMPFEDASMTTVNFYNASKEFINEIEDKVLRTKYLSDLNSYLQNNSTVVNPREFADQYIKTASERDRYKSAMQKNAVPFSQFPKDLKRVQKKIEKMMVAFENGISIIGNDGDFKNKVKFTKVEGGKHKAEITSKIKKVD